VYAFVTDGIESALEQAKAAAGEKDVAVMGGAEVGQRYLRAGLVDEISSISGSAWRGSRVGRGEAMGQRHDPGAIARIVVDRADRSSTPL
jgi:riboflavin biosynthesis pyrimidine reductase